MSDEHDTRAARAAATLAEARELISRQQFALAPEREWLAAGIAAALDEERARQRAVQAEIVAHLQREFDGALADMREEFEAKLADLVVRTDQLSAELCRKMELTISEMRHVLAAGDAIAAEDGPPVLN